MSFNRVTRTDIEFNLRNEVFSFPDRWKDKLKKEKKILVISSGGLLIFDMLGYFSLFQSINALPKFEVIVSSSAGCISSIVLTTTKITIRELAIRMIEKFQKIRFASVNPLSMLSFINNGFLHAESPVKNEVVDFIFEQSFTKRITFLEHFQQTGVRLIITMSGLNTKKSYYASVDTLPNLEIRDAVRASSSIPYIWKPVTLKTNILPDDLFFDGAVLESYPIDCLLQKCSRRPYEELSGVRLPTLTSENFFGLKVRSLTSGYHPIYSTDLPNPQANPNISFFSSFALFANVRTFSQDSNIRKEWIEQTAGLINEKEPRIIDTVTPADFYNGYNNGINSAIRTLQIYESSQGKQLRIV